MITQEILQEESFLLSRFGLQASDALSFDFINETGYCVLMAPNLYSKVEVNQGCKRGPSVCNFPEGVQYPRGIDDFVKEALKDRACRALVPLTDEVRSVLKNRHKLSIIPLGVGVEPEGILFEGYRK